MNSWQENIDKASWNQFVADQPNGSFLQSFEFGEFQKSLGKKVWWVGLKNEKLQGICLLVRQETKFGKFLYSPGGPIASVQDIDSLIKLITQLAKRKRSKFCSF